MALWKKLVFVAAGIIIGVPVLLSASFLVSHWGQNASYANRVFNGVAPYDSVLASRRYHSIGFAGYGCTYAIVRLSDEATAEPPALKPRKSGKRNDPFDSFGGDWQATPGPDLGDPRGDGPWITCQIALGGELYAQLRTAITTPGGWWIGQGGKIQVYSPATKLAFKLREGD